MNRRGCAFQTQIPRLLTTPVFETRPVSSSSPFLRPETVQATPKEARSVCGGVPAGFSVIGTVARIFADPPHTPPLVDDCLGPSRSENVTNRPTTKVPLHKPGRVCDESFNCARPLQKPHPACRVCCWTVTFPTWDGNRIRNRFPGSC
jgi:hypothetical protein